MLLQSFLQCYESQFVSNTLATVPQLPYLLLTVYYIRIQGAFVNFIVLVKTLFYWCWLPVSCGKLKRRYPVTVFHFVENPMVAAVLRIRIRDPVSGAFLCFLTTGSGIRDEHPGSYFRELRNNFWGTKNYLNSLMRIWLRDPGFFDRGFGIQDGIIQIWYLVPYTSRIRNTGTVAIEYFCCKCNTQKLLIMQVGRYRTGTFTAG